MKECSEKCREKGVGCPVLECKYWIDHGEDHNCALIAIDEHGPMFLEEISKRIGVSHVRVLQIQNAALKKLSKRYNKEKLLCILPD